jgi:hypothetical protein
VWGQPGHGAQFRLTLPLTAGGELSSSPLPLRPAVVRRHGLEPDPAAGRAALVVPGDPGPEADPDAVDEAELAAVDDEGLQDLHDLDELDTQPAERSRR